MSFEPIDWSYNTNIYEVNLRQYTTEGTFNAFARSLPRLRDMGIEILWFMPITPISVEKRKGTLGSYYACSDYTNTNPEFGTVDDFKNLVNTAQEIGFKIIIDWVANHTGWDHRWTHEHPDYYVKDVNGNFTERNGWDDVIDLNYDNPELRKAVIAAMKFWIDECGIDGFRCDMAHLVPLDFWIEARTELDQIKKLFWLAECEVADYHQAFDATYTWRWMHKTEEFAKHQTDINGLWDLFMQYDNEFPQNAFRAYFTSNHDENSWNGTEYEKYGPAAKNLAVFCCTWNGLPLIYSGQEMPNYKRLKFFDKDAIEWTGNYELHDFYKTLLNLRKQNAALRAGDNNVVTHKLQTNADNKVFSFLRKNGNNEVLVILNFSSQQILLEIQDASVQGVFKNVFDNSSVDFTASRHINILERGNFVFAK
ncbi:MAG TPA: alpha-amylase family glycosyl hydrolase [Puia sp.]|jgi:alpha-amylase|nr:alpha-amylase family glycosyl hydrolase [Puia sp.]